MHESKGKFGRVERCYAVWVCIFSGRTGVQTGKKVQS